MSHTPFSISEPDQCPDRTNNGRSHGHLTALEKRARQHRMMMRDGVQVRVLEFDLGPQPARRTLLVVPGMATVFQSWQEAVQLLSDGYRIFYFESREKASSVLPDHPAKAIITLREMALDLGEVTRQLGLELHPYYVLASSTGSTILIEALSHGWILPRGAILVGPMVKPRIGRMAAFLTSCTPMALKNLVMPFYRAYLRAVYVNRKRHPEQYAKYIRAAEEVELPKIYRLLWEMTTYDGSELLANVTTPCLLAGASRDGMHVLAETRRIQRLLPKATVIDLGSNEAAHGQPLVDAIQAFVMGLEKDQTCDRSASLIGTA
jgi:alpha-beta hydrolase superfamily lysophospholipase